MQINKSKIIGGVLCCITLMFFLLVNDSVYYKQELLQEKSGGKHDIIEDLRTLSLNVNEANEYHSSHLTNKGINRTLTKDNRYADDGKKHLFRAITCMLILYFITRRKEKKFDKELRKLDTYVDEGLLMQIFGDFENDLKLSDYLDSFSGNQTRAYNAVRKEAQRIVDTDKLEGEINNIDISVNYFEISANGYIVEGTFELKKLVVL